MSVEKLSDGLYLCSIDETKPLMLPMKPRTKGDNCHTWYCTACDGIIEYKREDICPHCHRAIDWSKC